MRLRVCWLVLFAWLWTPPTAAGQDPAFQSGVRLAEYRERLAAERLRADDPAQLAALVQDVQIELHGEPEHLREGLLELLALSALAVDLDARVEYATRYGREPSTSENTWFAALRSAGEVGRAALTQLLGAPGAGADARVLVLLAQACATGDEARRLVAVELLATRTEVPATLALFTCLRAPRARLRAAAARALAGRADPAVDRIFVGACESLDAGAAADVALLSACTQHWRARRGALEASEAARLTRVAARALAQTDWRHALLAAQWSLALPLERAAPLLIEALAAWQQRTADGRGSRRVEAELVASLEAQSGRRIGHRLDWWRSWWDVRRRHGEREIDAGGQTSVAGPPPGTAQFFGLELYSDRVVFVLDRSGSMDEALGAQGRTRYETAVQELRACLYGLGETARFDVVVFHSGAEAWRGKLVGATKIAQREVLQWLEGQGPGGATDLQAGLELVQRRGADGSVRWDELAADTAVVLCDGQIQRPRSVRDWLRENDPLGLLRVHCVQVGALADGQLEELARATGGTFRRVDS